MEECWHCAKGKAGKVLFLVDGSKCTTTWHQGERLGCKHSTNCVNIFRSVFFSAGDVCLLVHACAVCDGAYTVFAFGC